MFYLMYEWHGENVIFPFRHNFSSQQGPYRSEAARVSGLKCRTVLHNVFRKPDRVARKSSCNVSLDYFTAYCRCWLNTNEYDSPQNQQKQWSILTRLDVLSRLPCPEVQYLLCIHHYTMACLTESNWSSNRCACVCISVASALVYVSHIGYKACKAMQEYLIKLWLHDGIIVE